MTTSNHLYTGALIALAIPYPALAIPLAFASHFVLDALPHFGYGGEGYGEALKHRLTYVMESVNLIAVPLLAYLLWGQSLWVWVAAIVALSPDFVWIYRYFWFERKGLPPPAGPVTRFHKRIQWREVPWGWLVEYPFMIIMIYMLIRIAV